MAKKKTPELDFKLFFAVWAKKNNWQIPKLHIEIVEWLSDYQNWRNNTGVLQVFRGGAKSTIIGCFIAYQLVKNPEFRFLILSADYDTSVRVTNDLTNIVANHPFATHLRGKEKTWRENKIWVEGSTDARSPSAYSVGILSNITGSRADFIIFDDVEVPKNAQNEKLRAQLRTRISDTVHILVPGGIRLFVGTPHSYDSIYPEVIDREASSLKIPLLRDATGDYPNITGESSWPERFDEAEILKRQRESLTKANFLSQYQLIPYNAGDAYFDASLLNIYRTEPDIYSANSETVLTIGNKRMVSCSCFWDPSLAQAESDDSVLALVFTTAEGQLYVHRAIQLKGDAFAQCEQVKKFCLDFHVPKVIVEVNGVGAFLPAILRKTFAGQDIAIDTKHTTKSKSQKIVEALEVPLSAGYIFAHEQVRDSAFLTQLRDFNPSTFGYKGFKDDFIDAVASAICNEPIRITGPKPSTELRKRWAMGHGEIEVAHDPIEF